MEKYERCRWGSQDSLEDTYCVNGACEHCTEFVGGEDSPCDDCHLFFSCDDGENMRNSDVDTESLL